MLTAIIAAITSSLAQALPKEIVAGVFSAISSSQRRKVIRRAVRDLVEDEVTRALQANKVPYEQAMDYVKDNKSYYKQEIRNRFDPVFRR